MNSLDVMICLRIHKFWGSSTFGEEKYYLHWSEKRKWINKGSPSLLKNWRARRIRQFLIESQRFVAPVVWSSMHWKIVSKQCLCWAIITSLSGMKEKLRIIFEATTAHCCFSARPSSSILNRPSSSNHQSEERCLVPLWTEASVLDGSVPLLP